MFFGLKPSSLLYTSTDLERAAREIRGNGRVLPRADLCLRVRHLRAEIPRRVAQALADRVDADEVTRIQEVLAGNITGALRVHLSPRRVRVIRQELLRRELVLRVAVRRLLGRRERHRARAEVLEALHGSGVCVVTNNVLVGVNVALVVVRRIECTGRRTVHRCRGVVTRIVGVVGGVIIRVVVILKALEFTTHKSSKRRVNHVKHT